MKDRAMHDKVEFPTEWAIPRSDDDLKWKVEEDPQPPQNRDSAKPQTSQTTPLVASAGSGN